LKYKNLSTITFSATLFFIGFIFLGYLDIGIPILRQFIVFIYLTFVPGILFLCVLKVNHINKAEFILYSIGLSLSFLMFIGVLINFIYPLIGISKPISEIPLVLTLGIILLSLSLLLRLYSTEFQIYFIDIKPISVKIILLFTLLPIISIIGAYQLNYHNDNTIILTIYGVISVLPLIISLLYTKNCVKSTLPFIIWTISISLLFSVSLSVRHLSFYQSDATIEYFYSNMVYTTNVWSSFIPGSPNAMLGVVMLHPIYAIMMNMPLTDIFKIVHPLIYSLTPVALYIAFKRQTNEIIAFLSTFFYMSLFPFFVVFSRNTRTGLAVFFLALFILLLTNINICRHKKRILSIIFSLSIVVTHYGTSYLFLFVLISSTLLVLLINIYNKKQIIMSDLTKNFAALYLVFSITWYIHNSSSSAFTSIVRIFEQITIQISDILQPETTYSSYIFSNKWVFSVGMSRDLLLIASIFIFIGMASLIVSVIKKKDYEIQHDFAMFSISFFIMLISTFLPTMGSINPSRSYLIALSSLAPFSVIGFIQLCKKIAKCRDERLYFKLFSLFLSLTLLFNSGFISEKLTEGNDYSPNVIISKPRSSSLNDTQYILSFNWNYFNDVDIFSSKWLVKKKSESMGIYTDRSGIFYPIMGPYGHYYNVGSKTNIVRGNYIFLHSYNIAKGYSIVEAHLSSAVNNSPLSAV